jgi:hypothetical protein
LSQLEDRLILAEMNAEVQSRKEWDQKRLEAARRFWEVKEHLFRRLWRLGLLRHIFQFDFRAPEWNQEYQEFLHKSKTKAYVALNDHKEA